MIDILSQNGQEVYGLISFVADTEEDKNNISTVNLKMGTKCYVVATQQQYILNSAKEWNPFVSESGGGSNIITEELNVIENGTYTAPEGKAYSPVEVNVPNTYTANDEGKVVNNGALVSQSSLSVTSNKTYNTTLNDQVIVNVTANLQSKTGIVPGISDITVTPDNGYDGLSSVQIDGDADFVAENIKKDVVLWGITGTYESRSPILSTSVTPASPVTKIEVTLPKTMTTFVCKIDADAETLSDLYADTSTNYAFVSGIFYYPDEEMSNGTKTANKFSALTRYRPSAAAFYTSTGVSLSLSGTTLTINMGTGTWFYSGGTFNVKIWEVAT